MLKELVQLMEGEMPNDSPVEMADVIKYFPNRASKALQVMWGKDRLLFKGVPFGDAYERIVKTAEQILKREKVEAIVHLDHQQVENLGASDWHEFTFEAEPDDAQEVYCGVDPKTMDLYVGFDLWIHDEEFYSAWDTAFKSNVGVPFDEENDDHNELLSTAWKAYQHSGGFSALVRVGKNPEVVIESSMMNVPGMFYHSIFNSAMFKRLGLIDIRLD